MEDNGRTPRRETRQVRGGGEERWETSSLACAALLGPRELARRTSASRARRAEQWVTARGGVAAARRAGGAEQGEAWPATDVRLWASLSFRKAVVVRRRSLARRRWRRSPSASTRLADGRSVWFIEDARGPTPLRRCQPTVDSHRAQRTGSSAPCEFLPERDRPAANNAWRARWRAVYSRSVWLQRQR